MILFEKFKIQLFKLITGGMLRQLIVLFVLFVLIFEGLTIILNMESSWLFHNMTTFDYPPKDNHITLQLIYLVGVIFFSGFLVMILTNGARNKIDMYKSGDVRLRLKNKISILGFNEIALGIINEYLGDKRKYNIEIIVEKGVSDIRDKIDGIYGTNNRIYVLHGSRNSKQDILAYHLEESKAIYIVGENEENADIKNIECCSEICKQYNSLICDVSLYLYEQASFTLIINGSYNGRKRLFDKHRIYVVNSDENWSRRILVEQNVLCNERSLYNRSGKCPTAQSDCFVHLLIFGMSDVGEVLAKTAALTCHFPNFITKGIKTKITVIDDDFNEHRGIFGGRYSDYLDMCHYSLRSIKNGQSVSLIQHKPKNNLDLMEIEWEFIESVSDDVLLQSELSDLCDNENEILTIVVCYDNDAKNINTALGLPRKFFDLSIPIWLHVKSDYSLSNMLLDSRYDNISIWGMVSDFKTDSWYESTAKLINYYYCTMDFNNLTNENYHLADKEKVENSWNQLTMELKMDIINNVWGLTSMFICMPELGKEHFISDESISILERMEHVRWVTSVVLRGFRPLTEKQKEELAKNHQIKRELKRQFYHADIDYYDNCDATLCMINKAIIRLYDDLSKQWKERFLGDK